MIKLNEHTLYEYLKKHGFDPKKHAETNQIATIHEHEKTQFPTFFRFLHDNELLQLMTFIPYQFTSKTASDLAEFLHMANRELDMPGLCMDRSTGTIFYRIMLPTMDGECNENALAAYIRTSHIVCETFGSIIQALALGAMSLQEVMQKTHEVNKSKNQKKEPVAVAAKKR